MEKYMKKLLLPLFSLILSFNSYGEWTKTNMDVNGASYFIDFETVKKKTDGYVVWWGMEDFVKGRDGKMSTAIYNKGDCEESRTIFLSVVLYEQPMGRGKSEDLSGGGIINFEDIIGWSYPPPGSVAISNLKIVCSLADQSSMNNYQSKVLELIAEYESYEWGD